MARDGPGVVRFSDRDGRPIRRPVGPRARRPEYVEAPEIPEPMESVPVRGPVPFVWDPPPQVPRPAGPSLGKVVAALAVGGLLAGAGTKMLAPGMNRNDRVKWTRPASNGGGRLVRKPTPPRRKSTVGAGVGVAGVLGLAALGSRALVPVSREGGSRALVPVRPETRSRALVSVRPGTTPRALNILPVKPANSGQVPHTPLALTHRLTNEQARALVEGNGAGKGGRGWYGVGVGGGLAGLWKRWAARRRTPAPNTPNTNVRDLVKGMLERARNKDDVRRVVHNALAGARNKDDVRQVVQGMLSSARNKDNARRLAGARNNVGRPPGGRGNARGAPPPMPPPLPPLVRGAAVAPKSQAASSAPKAPPGPPPLAPRQASLDPLLQLLGIRTGVAKPSSPSPSTPQATAGKSKRAILEAASLALETFAKRPGVSAQLRDSMERHVVFLRKEHGKMGLILLSSPGAFMEALAVAMGKVKESAYDAYELEPTGRHLVLSADEVDAGRAAASVHLAMSLAADGKPVTPAALTRADAALAHADRPRNQTNRSGVPRRVATMHTLARQASRTDFRTQRAAYLRGMYQVMWKVLPRDAPPAVKKQVDAVAAKLRAFRKVRQIKAAVAFFESNLRVATGDVVRVIAALRTRGKPVVGDRTGKDVSEFSEKLKARLEEHKEVTATAAEWALFLRRARASGMNNKLPLVAEVMEPKALANARKAPRTYLNAAKSSRVLKGRF